jgi:hypothetical protein
MNMPTENPLRPLTVDGSKLRWRIERNPQWCTADGWRGTLLYAEPASGGGCALKIELPFSIHDHRSTPHRQRTTLSDRTVAKHIKRALQAGWNTASRGKPFLYFVAQGEDAE